jgi:hypothetical protein
MTRNPERSHPARPDPTAGDSHAARRPQWPASLERDVGELTVVEQQTIARAQERGRPRWKVAGRDDHGQLVLGTIVPAGRRLPGKRRLCLMTLTPEGLYYNERLIDSTQTPPCIVTQESEKRPN